MIRVPWSTQPPVGTPLDLSHPLTQGLVGCWPMNEGGGNLISEVTGLNNTAIAANTTWNQKINFNNVNSIVDCGNKAPLQITDKITLCSWIKPRTLVGDNQIITKGHTSLAEPYVKYGLLTTGSTLLFQLDLAGRRNLLGGTLLVNNDYFVAATYSGTQMVIYINGVLVNIINITGNIGVNTVKTTIGAYYPNAGPYNFFDGGIWESKIYARTLSPQEIKSLYENPYQIYQPLQYWICPLTGLQMYVDIDGTVKQVQAAYGLVGGVVKQMNPYVNIGGIVKQL